MKKELVSAIISAIDMYVQQEAVEEDEEIFDDEILGTQGGTGSSIKNSGKSNWKMFGQQDQLRARTNWRVKKS